MKDTPAGWSWELAVDGDEVHELLCASDAFQAALTGTPVPTRSVSTTRRNAREGFAYVLRFGGEAAATFTLTSRPPFDVSATEYPSACAPVYLQRLAVRPDLVLKGSLVGPRCVRKAIQIGRDGGADVLRSEANPDLTATRALLDQFGFRQYGPTYCDDTDRRWVYLQRDL